MRLLIFFTIAEVARAVTTRREMMGLLDNLYLVDKEFPLDFLPWQLDVLVRDRKPFEGIILSKMKFICIRLAGV